MTGGVLNSSRLVLFKCLGSEIYSNQISRRRLHVLSTLDIGQGSLFSFIGAAVGLLKRGQQMKRLSSCILLKLRSKFFNRICWLEIVQAALVKFRLLSFTQIMWQSTFRFINCLILCNQTQNTLYKIIFERTKAGASRICER